MSNCTECTYYPRLSKNPVAWPCSACSCGEKFQERGTREKPKPLRVQVAEKEQHIAALEAALASATWEVQEAVGWAERADAACEALEANIAERNVRISRLTGETCEGCEEIVRAEQAEAERDDYKHRLDQATSYATDVVASEIDRLRAEVERKEKALEFIRDRENDPWDNPASVVQTFREVARAALAAESKPESSSWFAISTAPKDGTHILACIAGDKATPATVVHWWNAPGEEGFYPSVCELEQENPYPATHWMLIDERPKTESEPEGGE